MKKEDLVKVVPNPLPNNSKQKLVISSYTIEEENKEKLKKVAKRHGYESSVSAFLNDLLTCVFELEEKNNGEII